MNRELLHRVIAKFAGKRIPITDEVRVYQDLFIAGDDAVDLLDEIRRELGVKLDGFDFESYFPNESEALFWHVLRIFGIQPKKKTMTVGHLASVIERGFWFEP